MILRLLGVLFGLGQIAGFVLMWLLWDDFNSTVLINGGLMLVVAFLSHLNEEAHRLIREQQQLIQRMLANGFHLP